MKEFLLALIVAVGLGFAAASILESGQQTVGQRYTSSSSIRN